MILHSDVILMLEICYRFAEWKSRYHKKEPMYSHCSLYEHWALEHWNPNLLLGSLENPDRCTVFPLATPGSWEQSTRPHPFGGRGMCQQQSSLLLTALAPRSYGELTPDKTIVKLPSLGTGPCLNLIGSHSPYCNRLWDGGSIAAA